MNTTRLALVLWSFLLGLAAMPAHGVEIEGFQFDDVAVVDGHRLVLNGAGWRKRGYTKNDVIGLYLEAAQSSVEAVVRHPGRKRLLLRPLRDLPGATISRYFVNDFRLTATDTEFKSLINEVMSIGAVFGRLHALHKGDVVTIDWVPGKGLVASVNGTPQRFNDAGDVYLNSELMFKIILRMNLSVTASEDLRLNLLGQSTSMQGLAQ